MKAQLCPELNCPVRSQGLRGNCLHVQGQAMDLLLKCRGELFWDPLCSVVQVKFLQSQGLTGRATLNICFSFSSSDVMVPTVQWLEPILKIRFWGTELILEEKPRAYFSYAFQICFTLTVPQMVTKKSILMLWLIGIHCAPQIFHSNKVGFFFSYSVLQNKKIV